MTSNLRQRPSVAKGRDDDGGEYTRPPAAPKPRGCPVNAKGRSWTRKILVILVPAYILAVMFEALEPPELLLRHAWDDIKTQLLGMDPRVFSVGELKALSGGKRPMLSIVGEVFDVSMGEKHYGKRGVYRGFTGRDASRAFITGDFTEAGLTDDVTGLEPSQCLGIKDWLGFYKGDTNKYKRRGVLAGTFYDQEGNPTAALRDFERCVTVGKREKEKEAAEKKLYPNCNSRWAMAEGGKVWCEDPQKVPRKIPARAVHGADIRNSGGLGGKVTVEDDKKDAKTAKGRCACFDRAYAEANEDRLLSYGGCAPDANKCITKPPEPAKK